MIRFVPFFLRGGGVVVVDYPPQTLFKNYIKCIYIYQYKLPAIYTLLLDSFTLLLDNHVTSNMRIIHTPQRKWRLCSRRRQGRLTTVRIGWLS